MSDEAPKEIWIEDEFGEGHEDRWSYGTWDCRNAYGYQTPYLLKSHTLALVAESYEVASLVPMKRLARGDSIAPGNIGAAIQRLTPADAIAARDARDTQVREEALREAAALINRKIKAVQPEMSRRAQRLSEGKKPGFQYAIHRADLDARMSDRDTILALIEKDKTNDE